MTKPEFPADLVERCAVEALGSVGGIGGDLDTSYLVARAILRESGHAELVAALKEARAWFQTDIPIVRRIDAALRKAGAL